MFENYIFVDRIREIYLRAGDEITFIVEGNNTKNTDCSKNVDTNNLNLFLSSNQKHTNDFKFKSHDCNNEEVLISKL